MDPGTQDISRELDEPTRKDVQIRAPGVPGETAKPPDPLWDARWSASPNPAHLVMLPMAHLQQKTSRRLPDTTQTASVTPEGQGDKVGTFQKSGKGRDGDSTEEVTTLAGFA